MSEIPPFGPERDRRRRKRILTKKTIGIALVVLVVVFMAITVWSEMSDEARFGKGRLYSSRMNIPELAPRESYDVVTEKEISASSGADPMLLRTQEREQMLGVEPGMLERQHGIYPDAPQIDPNDSAFGGSLGSTSQTGTAGVRITGGPEGVRIEKKD
jgi:hypothetical protein